MPPIKGFFRNYTLEDLKAAVEDVKINKLPLRAAAKKHGIPRVTLRYKVDGTRPLEQKKMGPPSVLSTEEERALTNWMKDMAAAGFPVTISQLQDSVQDIMKDLKRVNPFKNDRPGRVWVKAFRRRNPDVSDIIGKYSKSNQQQEEQSGVSLWFTEIENYLKINKLEDIVKDPVRIFNCDEIAFFLNPKKKFVARQDDDSISANCDKLEYIAVLSIGNAKGQLATPLVIYNEEQLSTDVTSDFPSGMAMGKNDSGWMDPEIFFEFVTNNFHPWLIKQNITLPIILFVDGYASFLSLRTSQFCNDNGIILIALYANVKHSIKPMDVAISSYYEQSWTKKRNEWQINRAKSENFEIKNFAKSFKEIHDGISETIVVSGFRETGIFPWNPSTISASQMINLLMIDNPISLADKKKRLKYFNQGFRFLNYMIGDEKVKTFQRSSEEWKGDLFDENLFKLWRSVNVEIKNLEDICDEIASGSV